MSSIVEIMYRDDKIIVTSQNKKALNDIYAVLQNLIIKCKS